MSYSVHEIILAYKEGMLTLAEARDALQKLGVL